ncbi:hypothetical protein H6G89_27880 [Oscillatoria sp. FACHB-1407]|uniref:hypothetical protein n=1 Tax=Oscillatoria sp. FACHB-1407 TaxID=2692847 RepID=UPI0016891F2D|nr:hypothetical protein [Oscillatoria sp. FACHB-1407]MBD2464826.1 hypothetical protein [Oscillatoria sp. FACHB-1407]
MRVQTGWKRNNQLGEPSIGGFSPKPPIGGRHCLPQTPQQKVFRFTQNRASHLRQVRVPLFLKPYWVEDLGAIAHGC